jgi:hypothetical protein
MSSPTGRRRLVFLLSMAVLVAWVGVVTLAGQDHQTPSEGVERGVNRDSVDGREVPRALGQASVHGAMRSALIFMRAYARYEVGGLAASDRDVLTRYSTSEFGEQLLLSPARAPQGSYPDRRWVSRVAGVHVGLYEGRPAYFVSVVLVGAEGADVVTPILSHEAAGWLVAGVGA